jgi:hypothetical protein
MPTLLKSQAFDPDEIAVMATAYEEALRELHLTDRQDLVTLIVAERIIDAVTQGERDPARLREAGIKRSPG